MKIGIMTFQETTNYGALLQTMALQKAIQMIGGDSELIRYKCNEIVKRELPGSIFDNGFFHAPISLMTRIIQQRKYRKMERFKHEHCKLSEAEYSRSTISSALIQYNRFLVGSDIVWELNVTGGDTAFYLDFVNDSSLKYSFSSSFGYDHVPDQYLEVTKKLLSDFNVISVRENEGANIIQNLLGRKVLVTADPTILLTADLWRKYELSYHSLRDKEYVLVYFDDNSGSAIAFAKKIAKSKGLNIVYIRNSLRGIDGVKTIRDASVEQFLWLIDNAKVIVTGSYHGVLFSINFNKEFYYVNRAHPGRINTIIDVAGIKNRDIMSNEVSEDEIDWSAVNKRINQFRDASLSRLKDIVGIRDECE